MDRLLFSRLSVIPHEWWWEHWRGALLTSLILSAVITPDGSGVTMVFLFVPLMLLYGIGAVLSKSGWDWLDVQHLSNTRCWTVGSQTAIRYLAVRYLCDKWYLTPIMQLTPITIINYAIMTPITDSLILCAKSILYEVWIHWWKRLKLSSSGRVPW